MNNKSVADRAAPQSEKSLHWNLVQAVTLLGVVGLVFVVLLLFQIGRTHDDHAAATSLRLYDGLVSLKVRHLGTNVRDYTHWDEAVERLATAYDEEWWENNAGVYAVQTFDLSFSLAVDGHDNPRLISTADGTRNEPSAEVLTPSLRTLLAQARNKPVSEAAIEAVATGVVWFEDALHLAVAVRYLSETEDVVNPDPDALLVFAWSVPDYLLAVIGEIMERSLHHRAELPEGAVGISLILADGTSQGWVTWSEPKPPLAAVGIVIPALLAVLLIIIFLAFFARHARKLIGQLHDAEQRAQYQLTFHRIAAETATALTTIASDAEFDTAINQCLQRLGLLFGVDRSYVFQFSDDLAHATNTHEWCADGISSEMDNLQNLPMDEMSWLMARLLCDGVLHARVADLPPEAAAEKAEHQRQGIQSFLLATTHGAHGKLAGFIGFDCVRKERSWRDDELAMLQTIAGVVGSVSVRRRIENDLLESEEMQRTLLQSVPDLIVRTDMEGTILFVNDFGVSGFESLRGQDIYGKNILSFVAEHDVPRVLENLRLRLVKNLGPQEYQLQLGNDAFIDVESNGDVIRDKSNNPVGMVYVIRDITSRKRSAEQLQQAASVFEHANEGIMITDASGRILDVNKAFTRITDFHHDEVIGKNPRMWKSGRQDSEFYADMRQQLITRGSWAGELWNRRKNGESYAAKLTISAVRDSDDRVLRYVALFSDITPQKEHQRQLEYVAHHDVLTGLPNRVLLADRMSLAMTRTLRRSEQLAVVYLDLDGFKAVNDSYGHDIGDQLLVALAERMKDALREGDTLARLGGDEFVAVLVDLPNVKSCLPLLQRLLDAVAEPVYSNELVLQGSASLGVTFYPQAEPIDADQLLRQADQAMYQAKITGKNRYHLFDAAYDRDLRSRHESIERLREAFDNQEFVLYYQPKVDMLRGTVIGAEALIRWQHPQRGLLSPAAFLPLLENHVLMVRIGDWVIDTALAQIVAWRKAGLVLPVSVNVDPQQLVQVDFVDKLKTALAHHPTLEFGDLELEIVETSTLQDIKRISGIIDACRSLGVGFSLDDFGTGYSSLTYLKRLPVETLKICQSFVRDMLDDPDDLAILEGVIGLADSFRRKVIAEGVETLAHGRLLLQLGCEYGQGYAIARPMPPDQIPHWQSEWQPDPSWVCASLVDREHLPVLFAMVEHRAWINRLYRYLNDVQSSPPPLDRHQCNFGIWFDEMARQGKTSHPAYGRIILLHENVHNRAVELTELKSRGDAAQALLRFGEIEVLRDELLEELSRVID